jgi:hypothetical protein
MTTRVPSNSYARPLIFRAGIHRPCRASDERPGVLRVGSLPIRRYPEAKMTIYRAYIVGLHDRSIGVVQLECINDESAIKSARRLVDSHDVELWQMDRPVARFDARSKQMCKK